MPYAFTKSMGVVIAGEIPTIEGGEVSPVYTTVFSRRSVQQKVKKQGYSHIPSIEVSRSHAFPRN